jgi:hypothetical protein
MASTLEEKRLAAKRALAKKRRDELEDSIPQEIGQAATSVGYGFNRGLAKGAGALVDLTNLALMPVGLSSEEPVGGSKWLEKAMRGGGLTVEEGESEYPFLARIGEEVGAAAPIFGGAGAVARTGAQGGRFMRPILESFRREPWMNAYTELAASTGAGIGGAAAHQMMPESEQAEVLGQVLGGVFTPASWVGPARRGMSALARKFDFFPGRGERVAARQLRDIMEMDQDEALAILRGESDGIRGSNLTPAQETEDPGLLRLERAMAKSDPDMEDALRGKARATQQDIRGEFDNIGGGSPEVTQDYLQQRVDQIKGKADEMAAKALLRAKQAIDNMPQDVSREQASRIVRDRIESAHDEMKGYVDDMWARVDESAETPTDNLYQVYNKAKSELKDVQKDDMPSIAKGFLGGESEVSTPIPPDSSIYQSPNPMEAAKRQYPDWEPEPSITEGLIYLKKPQAPRKFSETEELGEVQAFRSKLLDEYRAEAAKEAPNRNKMRILTQLQEAALRDMENSADAETVQAAREATNSLRERFSQGVIGKIRGRARAGGLSVSPEGTLATLLREGPPGSVNIDDLSEAVQGDQEAMEAVGDYVRRMFVKQATNNEGRVNPNAARRFMDSYAETLNKFPSLKKQLSNVKSAQEVADRTSQRMANRVKSVTDKNRSRAALYLNSLPQQRIRRVLNSKKPVDNMREITKMVSKDRTGSALRGLKTEVLDELWRRSATKREGENILSGRKFEEIIENNRKTLSQLFSGDEMNRLKRVANTARKLEGDLASGRSLNEVLDETPDGMVDLLSRIVGANLGAMSGASQASGSSLVLAHAGSEKVRNLTQRLPMKRVRDILSQAVMDKGKMAHLLKKADTPKKKEALRRQLNSWLVNLVPEMEEQGRGEGESNATAASPQIRQ